MDSLALHEYECAAAPGSLQRRQWNDQLLADLLRLQSLARAPVDARQRIHLLPIDVHEEGVKVVIRTPQSTATEVLHVGKPAPALATWLFLEGIHALHHLHTSKIGHGAIQPTSFLAFDIPPNHKGGDAVSEYNSKLAGAVSDVLVPLYRDFPLLCHLFLAVGQPPCVLSGEVRLVSSSKTSVNKDFAPPALSKTHQQYLDGFHKTSSGDMWSFAATVFAVATGRVASSSAFPEEDKSFAHALSLLSPSQRAHGWDSLHPALQDILTKCLSPQPQARPSSDAVAQDPFVREMSARAAAAERAAAEHRDTLLELLTNAAKDRAAAARLDGLCVVPSSVGEEMRVAAGEGDTERLRGLLFTFHGDLKTINGKDCRLGTALHYAASKGKTQSVSLLLAHGADLTTSNARNATPLSLAAERGHLDCLKALLAVMPVPRVNASVRRWTLLHSASAHLQLDVVRFLLIEKGADVSCLDSSGRSAVDVVATSPSLLGRHGVLPESCRKKADALVALLRSAPLPTSSSSSSSFSSTAVAAPVSVESMLADLSRLVERTRLDAEEAKAVLAAAKHRALLFSPSSFAAFPPDLASQLRAAAAASNTKLLTSLLARASQRPQVPQAGDEGKTDGELVSPSLSRAVLATAVGKLDAALAAAVNDRDASGWSSCLLAARSGDTASLAALIRAGGKVDLVNSISKQTALHVAASNGHIDVVQFLLSLPAFSSQKTTASLVNATDARGATAIRYAREKGHNDVVRALSRFEELEAEGKAGADEDLSHKPFSSSLSTVFASLPTPPPPPPPPPPPTLTLPLPSQPQVSIVATAELHRLAKTGDHHQVRALLKKHGAALANADLERGLGRSALFVASRHGHSEVVAVVLAHGGDPFGRCSEGRTALHAAAERGHAKVLKILLDAIGPCPATTHEALNLKDNQGNTALHLSCHNGRKDVIRLLVAAGASSTLLNGEGRTCGEEAVLSTHRVTLEHALKQRGWA